MRHFLTLLAAILLASLTLPARSEAISRPNVLMIIADDLNDWVGCLGGHPDARTPNVDRLASRGLLFTNAHCAAPVCNPSRVATLTGRRPSSTGIYDNAPIWHEMMPGIASIPQHFKANGYYTAGGGKVYHHPPGFNRRSDWDEYFDQIFNGHYQARLARGENVKNFVWPDGYPLNGLPEVKALARPPRNAKEFDWGPLDQPDNEMGDGRMVQWAEKFLADPPEQPFFLAAGIYRPHLPWYAPREYFDMYPPDGITPPLIKEDDLDDIPDAGLVIAEQRRGDLELVRRSGQYQRILQAYLASVTFCDAMVGRLLDALDASPAAENTVIVFWSDNGWHFGEKEHLHKMTLWARSTRLPLIFVAPGITRQGTRTSRPASFVDLFPTLNELCDLPQPNALEGTSLVPLLEDPNRTWEQPALVTYLPGNHALCDERWRYIRYADGGEELYDHETDPNEWTNLAGQPELAGFKANLARWLPKTDAPSLRKKAKKSKSKVFLHEGNIAPGDAPGELKIVMRTAQYEEDSLTTDPPRAYSSVSRDGGHTWSPAVPESDLHNAKSKGYFGRASDGTHIYVYNDGPAQRDVAPGFPHGGRTSLRYKIKPTGGQWSQEKTFYHAGIKNSYPTLTEVAPGDFRAVWDSGTAETSRTHIHFGKLKITP